MRRGWAAGVGVMAAVVLVGCGVPFVDGWGSAGEEEGVCCLPPEPEPYDPEARLRPDLMQVTPEEVSPGGFVELHFPGETARGAGFVIEERWRDTWEVLYAVTASDQQPSGPPGELEDRYWPMPHNAPEPTPWPDADVAGSGPDFVVIPQRLAPGEYRICTAQSDPNVCAELTVTP